MRDPRRLDHGRRARPTLRLLQEDLSDGWDSGSNTLRAIGRHRWEDLQPLSCLPHLILRKAAESYGSDPVNDPPARTPSEPVAGRDLDGPGRRCSLGCAAGLAKGDHDDSADFYNQLEVAV